VGLQPVAADDGGGGDHRFQHGEVAAEAAPGTGTEGQLGVAVAAGLALGVKRSGSKRPGRSQWRGWRWVAAARPAAAAAEHLQEAVAVARAWEAPHWEAEAQAAPVGA
jgi:hypothetical protein